MTFTSRREWRVHAVMTGVVFLAIVAGLTVWRGVDTAWMRYWQAWLVVAGMALVYFVLRRPRRKRWISP